MKLPERFDLTYIDHNGDKKRPVMLHRAIYGSFERFFGILVEHFEGKFPLWLSPVPVRLVTVTDRAAEFANIILNQFKSVGITRASVDSRTETLGKKIRDAQLDKVNYIVTVGDKEVDNNTLSIRSRDGSVQHDVKVEDFIKQLLDEIAIKKL